MDWWVYMIEASDGALYTGITTDIRRRFSEHQGQPAEGAGNRKTRGKAARFFNGREPVGVVFLEAQPTRSAALIREAAIKKLKRTDKIALKQKVMTFDDR